MNKLLLLLTLSALPYTALADYCRVRSIGSSTASLVGNGAHPADKIHIRVQSNSDLGVWFGIKYTGTNIRRKNGYMAVMGEDIYFRNNEGILHPKENRMYKENRKTYSTQLWGEAKGSLMQFHGNDNAYLNGIMTIYCVDD